MAKMTKSQKKNMVKQISSKAFRLIESGTMTLADYDKINQACKHLIVSLCTYKRIYKYMFELIICIK